MNDAAHTRVGDVVCHKRVHKLVGCNEAKKFNLCGSLDEASDDQLDQKSLN